jgi:hypothetical protein
MRLRTIELPPDLSDHDPIEIMIDSPIIPGLLLQELPGNNDLAQPRHIEELRTYLAKMPRRAENALICRNQALLLTRVCDRLLSAAGKRLSCPSRVLKEDIRELRR